jgi:molybdopterin synthase sulfur carrier subunit
VIRLLFFARLREQLHCSDLEIQWQPELATVAALRQHLQTLQPGWKEVLAADNILCAVNQEQASDDTPVHAGAEVAFFPPVTGG